MKASPYTPGAGHVPPILAGRQGLTGAWEEMLSEIESSGRMHAEDTILSGPRGAGKTALLSTFHNLAEDAGYEVIVLQSVKGRGSLIDGLMRRANQRILANSGAWTKAKNTLERIGSVSLGVAGFSASAAVKTATPRPLPDAGLFADGLAELARAVRDEARHGGLLITIDELQVTDPADLALLAAALHRLNVEHPESHVAFAATGLPNTMGVLEAAGVTHPHRLFEERPVTLRLDERATRYAIAKPALDRDVTWEDAALTIAVRASNCYLAHIQEVAHATWREAGGPDVISEADARAGVHSAGERIARRELTPRWAAATDREVELLAALALNGGHGTSTEINAMLGREQKEWSAVRASLISAGDIYPTGQRAQLAFAMPTYPAYVLANYPFRQAAAGAVALVSLDEMRRRRERSRASGGTTALNQFAITFGIFIAYLIDDAFKGGTGGWRWMFGLGAVPGIAPAVATLTVPHTPRWLIEQGRSDDARAVLERTRSHRDIDAEVSEIEEVAEKQKQFTGLSISSSIAQAVLIGIVNLVFAGVAVLLLDRVGRRPPLIAGTLGSVLGLIVLGWYFSTAASFQHGHAWIALAAMLFYIACFEISLGPIFWVMIAEIFPLRSRAKAMAICTVFNWGFNFFVSFFFLDAVSGL